MTNRAHLPLIAFLVLPALSCVSSPEPPVTVHYLGHSSFFLSFDNGMTALTDYGQSRAYGLDSPVHGLGTEVPDLVTQSHEHDDHAGGELPSGIGQLLTGTDSYDSGGLSVTAIRTFERSLDEADNTSYLFEYGGKKILHLGDCQALIVNHAEENAQALIAELYPDNYDAVLVPIGFIRDILTEAAAFVTLLDAQRIVPMHYWSPADKEAFLGIMEGQADSRGRPYRVVTPEDAALVLGNTADETGIVEVMGLTPAPLGMANGSGSTQ